MNLRFGKKYILAVSGGPDSMAILNMYKKKAQAVCTINYQKRKDSDYDVSLVKDYCKQHNIKFYLFEVPKKMYEDHKNDNFQALARKIRYDFFVKICHQEKNLNLMIAHNLNDSFETAYMQFEKQSKALFYGIKPKTSYQDLVIYRPLLRFQKKTLARYCHENNLKYATDYTNEMDIYERNRVRKIINGWSNEKLLEFKKKILKYNRQHHKLDVKVNKTFKKWKEINFSYSMIKEIISNNKELAYYLIYEFLKVNLEKNNSENKIYHLIEFIQQYKNNHKKYRLENNRYLIIKNNCLEVIDD